MSAQDCIHEKHRIEREINSVSMFVRTWLDEFSLLTNNELEVCIAVLVDYSTENMMDRACSMCVLIPAVALKNRSKNYAPPKWKRFWNLASADGLTKRFLNSYLILSNEINSEVFSAVFNDLVDEKFHKID